MATQGTNDSNSLSWLSPDQLSPSMRAKLLAMALNGDSIVNPLGQWDERTPQGRARKEREQREEWAYRQAMAEIEERRVRFQERLDRLDHASLEALRENEEQMREAKERLRKIQERAYEVTMPDGSVQRVYRDGDKVRTESGAEVGRDVLRAEDIPDSASRWSDYNSGIAAVDDLERKRKAIVDYHKKIGEARDREASGDLSVDEIDKLERRLEAAKPQSVREHEQAINGPTLPARTADAEPQAGKILGQPFERAVSGNMPMPTLSEQDFDLLRQTPAASKPAPR